MLPHRVCFPVAAAAILVFSLPTCRAWGAESLSAGDRYALHEFRLNRLFSMLGYLEQRASNVGFSWEKAGFGEAGNAWRGLSAEGEALAPVVREIASRHEERHRARGLLDIARMLAGSAEGKGVIASAKVELVHATEDLQAIDERLAGEPPPTPEELNRLRNYEAQLAQQFAPFVPGLEAVAGGFTSGGSYKSRAYPDPNSTPYLSEYIRPRSVPASDDRAADPAAQAHEAAQAREAAFAQARVSLARVRTLVGYLAVSHQRHTQQVAAAGESLKNRHDALAALDSAMVKLPGLEQTSANLEQELQSLTSVTAALEASYIELMELGREIERESATICDYARRVKTTPEKQVRTWKAGANLTIHRKSSRLKSLRSEIDTGLAEVKQHRGAVLHLVRQLNLYDGLTLTLPFLAEAQDAQVRARDALSAADAAARQMTIAFGQIEQEKQQIQASLQPYALDQEANQIHIEVQRLLKGVVPPAAMSRDEGQQAVAMSSLPTLVMVDLSRYDPLEEALRTIDMDKTVARVKEAIQEAEAVETVGEAKAGRPYQALQQALDCYAKISGGTSSPTTTPPPAIPGGSTMRFAGSLSKVPGNRNSSRYDIAFECPSLELVLFAQQNADRPVAGRCQGSVTAPLAGGANQVRITTDFGWEIDRGYHVDTNRLQVTATGTVLLELIDRGKITGKTRYDNAYLRLIGKLEGNVLRGDYSLHVRNEQRSGEPIHLWPGASGEWHAALEQHP